jgi:hypothetical protein
VSDPGMSVDGPAGAQPGMEGTRVSSDTNLAAPRTLNLNDLQMQARFFRSLMDSRLSARQDSQPDVSAGLSAQHQIDQGPAPACQTVAADPTIAELIDRHVRRALAAVESQGDADVRLELSDAVFPGTGLRLQRTSAGWHLTATVDNRYSMDRLAQFIPALIERFERASLGYLCVSLVSGP